MATETATAHKNFVGGEWVEAVEGGTMDVINPATGEKIAEVSRGSQADEHVMAKID
jgi:acyl-CoA reductase-like NAD-dependent aldehyde dehydrogenase